MIRLTLPAGLSGLCVGSVTSAAVFFDRLALGAARTAVLGDLATTAAAMALATLTGRRSYAWGAFGAAIGIVVVHGALATVHGAPWMSDRAPQFVNDAVAALATLALVFTFARRNIELACVVGVTGVVGVYALTHSLWHLDHAPQHFVATVQQCVVAQFFSVLLALGVYRAARKHLVPS